MFMDIQTAGQSYTDMKNKMVVKIENVLLITPFLILKNEAFSKNIMHISNKNVSSK